MADPHPPADPTPPAAPAPTKRRPWWRRWWAITAYLVILIAMIASAGEQPDQPAAPTTRPAAPTSPTPDPSPSPDDEPEAALFPSVGRYRAAWTSSLLLLDVDDDWAALPALDVRPGDVHGVAQHVFPGGFVALMLTVAQTGEVLEAVMIATPDGEDQGGRVLVAWALFVATGSPELDEAADVGDVLRALGIFDEGFGAREGFAGETRVGEIRYRLTWSEMIGWFLVATPAD